MVASSSLRSLPLDLLTNILLRSPLTSILLWLPVKSLLPYKSLGSKSLLQCSSLGSLADDLLTDIFLRLPVKSLLLCKSVCKEWHTIISSSSFIKKHLNREGNLTRLVIYCYGGLDPETSSYSYFPDETTLERHEVPNNLLLWGEITYLRGPCNGIFCIYITKNKFALWNPTTRRLRLIQCCPAHIFDEVGFGMDPLTGDFKIVLIHSRFGVSPCFAVYTSSKDSWKYLEQESLRDYDAHIIDFVSGNNAYLNGFYYWIKNKHNFRDSSSTILVFDMHNEIFEETMMPKIAVQGKALHLLNDSLALVSFDPSYGDKRIEVWLMEGKGCWKKISSVILPFECLLLYGFWGRNKILVFTYLDNLVKLMLYDLDSHSARRLKVDNAFSFCEILPILYKESLFSLEGEDGIIQDYDTRSAEALEFMGYEGPNTKISCHDFREDAILWRFTVLVDEERRGISTD